MHILSDDRFVRHVQAILVTRGHYAGQVDGIPGPKTMVGVDRLLPSPTPLPPGPYKTLTDDAFVRAVQWRLTSLGFFNGYVGGNAGPITMEALQKALDAALPALPVAVASTAPLPWLEVAKGTLGWHERTNNAELRAFLKRDGKTLGNPDSLPWCGDWAETIHKVALPNEPFEGKLAENPYWALNWLGFGRRIEDPAYGCTAVKRRNGGGHVTTVVGQSSNGATLYCMGGNQSDRVAINAYPRSVFGGFRFPKSWAGEPVPLPVMDGRNIPDSPAEF